MYELSNSDSDVRSEFQQELLPGESLLWAGRPDPSVRFSATDLPRVIFGLVFTGFSVFWMLAASGMLFGAHQTHAPSPGVFRFFPLFGLPFFLIGLGTILSPFTYKRWQRKNTYYAVTNQRVITLVKKPTRNLQSTSLKDIPSVDKTVREDGIGTLNFGNPPMVAKWGSTGNNGYYQGPSYPIFYDIRDANSVYGIVLTQKANLGKE